MADPSPTTVGIIDAKIKLDAADFMAKIQEVKSAVGSLDSQRATVTIDVDVARALAQIEEVRAAAASLGDGSLHGSGGGSGAGRVAAGAAADTAATDLLTAAEHRERDAALEVAGGEREAAGSRRQAAVAAVEDAAATSRADSANRNFGNGLSGVNGRTALLAVGIGALVVAIAPLTGFAVGAAGALGMMGAAGVLAFLGVRNAIAQGTIAGQIFSRGLDSLTGDMTRLEATSAGGVLKSFQQGVNLINQSMPMLNASMGAFSQILGGTVVASIGAVLNIIRQLNPLFLIAALGVEHVAQAFRGWTAGTALQQFGDYAISVLPQVGQLLGDVVRAAVDLGASFAPLGGILLGVVDALVNVLDALARMGPSMSIIAGAALAVYGGFATWRAITPIILSVAGATDTLKASLAALSIPIAVAVGALGLIALTGNAINHSYNTSAQGVSAFTNALMNSNGATTTAIAHATSLQIKQTGLSSSLKIAGVSQATFTNAVVKGGATLDQMVAHMRAANEGQRTYAVGAGRMVNAQNQVELSARRLHAGLQQAVGAYNSYAKSVGAATVKDGAALQARIAFAHSLGTETSALTAAEGAQKQQAAAAAQAKAQMILEADAAGLLKLALDRLNGAAISDAEAQAAWAQGLDSLSLKTNKGAAALKGMSRAALENRGAIAQQVAVGQQAIESYANQAHSAGQVVSRYNDMKAALISQAVAMGASRSQARALVNEYFKFPKNIKTKVELQNQEAKAKLAETNSAAKQFTAAPHIGKITADNSKAVSSIDAAKKVASAYAAARYQAKIDAVNNAANAKVADSARKAHAFAANRYQAQMTGNNSDAVAKAAAAQAKAKGYAGGNYTGVMRGNPAPGIGAANTAKGAANSYAHGNYNAYLRAHTNAPQVAAMARAALASVQSRNVTLTAHYVTYHTNIASGGARLAQGGTVGAASGITATSFGTVRGPGSAFDDMAGVYALSNGEEVVSNMRGQADAWRPFLKAISAGRVSLATFAELGLHAPSQRRREAPQPMRQVNLGGIHIHHPVAQDPVTAAQHAGQTILAYVNYP